MKLIIHFTIFVFIFSNHHILAKPLADFPFPETKEETQMEQIKYDYKNLKNEILKAKQENGGKLSDEQMSKFTEDLKNVDRRKLTIELQILKAKSARAKKASADGELSIEERKKLKEKLQNYKERKKQIEEKNYLPLLSEEYQPQTSTPNPKGLDKRLKKTIKRKMRKFRRKLRRERRLMKKAFKQIFKWRKYTRKLKRKNKGKVNKKKKEKQMRQAWEHFLKKNTNE